MRLLCYKCVCVCVCVCVGTGCVRRCCRYLLVVCPCRVMNLLALFLSSLSFLHCSVTCSRWCMTSSSLRTSRQVRPSLSLSVYLSLVFVVPLSAFWTGLQVMSLLLMCITVSFVSENSFRFHFSSLVSNKSPLLPFQGWCMSWIFNNKYKKIRFLI